MYFYLLNYLIGQIIHSSNNEVYVWTGLSQSVQRLATGWAARGSYLRWDEIFRTRPDRPCSPNSLL